MPLQLGTYILCKFLQGGFHICLIRISYQKLVHQFRLWNDEKSLKVFFSLQIIFSHRVSRPHREFCGMPDSQDSSFFSHSFLWMGCDCHLLKWDDSNHMQYVSQNLSIMFSHFLHTLPEMAHVLVTCCQQASKKYGHRTQLLRLFCID